MEVNDYSEVVSQMSPLGREIDAGFLNIQLERYERIIDDAEMQARSAVYNGCDREEAWREVRLLKELRDRTKERLELLKVRERG